MSYLVHILPSFATLFSTYASVTATINLCQQAFYRIVPENVRNYLVNTIKDYFHTRSPFNTLSFTLVIPKNDGGQASKNQMFQAVETYLCHKLRHKFDRFKVISTSQSRKVDDLKFGVASHLTFNEEFQGIELTWKYVCTGEHDKDGKFELTVDKGHKAMIFDSYLQTLLDTVEEIEREKRSLNLWTVEERCYWRKVNLNHPFTFEKLAMDPVKKKVIMDDLDRFVRRKEFYRRVGKAWKRGYLLYGPPGTGKSSLIAAMANYLRFDVYDLQLSSVRGDARLRTLMMDIANKSIVVVEDIDCTLGLPASRSAARLTDRDGYGTDYDDLTSEDGDEKQVEQNESSKISLSALLNFIDGMWSSCGDEKIIVLTTNHKERLDPALLRPGRMDMHINMSYMNMAAFKVLASNYLLIEDHYLFEDIETLIGQVKVTPAEVAEELLRSEDANIVLQGVVNLLTGKLKNEQDENKNLLRRKKKKDEDNGDDDSDELTMMKEN